MKKIIAMLSFATVAIMSQTANAEGMSRMEHGHQHSVQPQEQPKHMPDTGGIYGAGTVNKMVPGKLNITHEPIKALGWPAMKMDFGVAKDVDLASVKPGDRVNFTLVKTGKYEYVITAINPNPAAPEPKK